MNVRGRIESCLSQVLEMLLVVLHESHREGDDKWKRLSRQVTDMVLPLLAKQQVINIVSVTTTVITVCICQFLLWSICLLIYLYFHALLFLYVINYQEISPDMHLIFFVSLICCLMLQ